MPFSSIVVPERARRCSISVSNGTQLPSRLHLWILKICTSGANTIIPGLQRGGLTQRTAEECCPIIDYSQFSRIVVDTIIIFAVTVKNRHTIRTYSIYIHSWIVLISCCPPLLCLRHGREGPRGMNILRPSAYAVGDRGGRGAVWISETAGAGLANPSQRTRTESKKAG